MLHAQWLQAVVPLAWFHNQYVSRRYITNPTVGRFFFSLLDNHNAVIMDKPWLSRCDLYQAYNRTIHLRYDNCQREFGVPHERMSLYTLHWVDTDSESDERAITMSDADADDEFKVLPSSRHQRRHRRHRRQRVTIRCSKASSPAGLCPLPTSTLVRGLHGISGRLILSVCRPFFLFCFVSHPFHILPPVRGTRSEE